MHIFNSRDSDNVLKIGLTGGIGSGKTVVSDQFAELGVPVIDTDVLARDVVKPGEPTLEQLVEVFGSEILRKDGQLDRDRLRRTVFTDSTSKQQLESILHPAIRERLQTRLDALDTPYCVIVVPLLVETRFYEMMDRILVIDAPEDRRVRWVMVRNGLTEGEVEQIMKNQATTEERHRFAHDIINNDAGIEELRKKVDRLHQKYLAISES